MINVSTLIGASGLYKRLGWREPTKTGYTSLLDADNLATASGLYFQDFNPLITVENVKESQPDPGIPDANFNIYLDNLQKSVILKVIDLVYRVKNDLIEEFLLFDNENVITKTIDNGTDFVGYEINLAKLKNIAAQINKIILEFDGAATFTLYLYHSTKQEAIYSQSVTSAENIAEIVTPTEEWIMQYDSLEIKGGKYYIGYYQSDLGSVKAINRNWNNAALMADSSYLGFTPIKATPNGTALFDLDDISYVSETYGLNFDISSFYNYTSQILENKHLFNNAIGYAMAVEVLKLIVTSTRSNRAERMSEESIAAFAELYGVPQKEDLPLTIGVEGILDNEIKKLQNNLFKKEQIKTVTAV